MASGPLQLSAFPFTPKPDLLQIVYTQENQPEKRKKPMQLHSPDFSTEAPPSNRGSDIVTCLGAGITFGCILAQLDRRLHVCTQQPLHVSMTAADLSCPEKSRLAVAHQQPGRWINTQVDSISST